VANKEEMERALIRLVALSRREGEVVGRLRN
jgi:hypothetical protein